MADCHSECQTRALLDQTCDRGKASASAYNTHHTLEAQSTDSAESTPWSFLLRGELADCPVGLSSSWRYLTDVASEEACRDAVDVTHVIIKCARGINAGSGVEVVVEEVVVEEVKGSALPHHYPPTFTPLLMPVVDAVVGMGGVCEDFTAETDLT